MKYLECIGAPQNMGKYPDDDGPPRLAPACACPHPGCTASGVAQYVGKNRWPYTLFEPGPCDDHFKQTAWRE